MSIWHGDRGRKVTGGVIKLAKKKRKYELGRLPLHTKIGKTKVKIVRVKGGGKKVKALSVEFANVFDSKTKVTKKVKILRVLENPANPHFVRMGIVTKGCIIETEIGKAKVTSRPSQHGIVNAILIGS
jgi:small subunit ribosomal protein S8e